MELDNASFDRNAIFFQYRLVNKWRYATIRVPDDIIALANNPTYLDLIKHQHARNWCICLLGWHVGRDRTVFCPAVLQVRRPISVLKRI